MPCLLMRLTDNNPNVKTEVYSHGLSVRQLKRDILWNIEVLLNSRSRPARSELLPYGETVANSVLGMGLSDFCGHTHSLDTRENLRKEILLQLKVFEPRLRADTIQVKLADKDEAGNGSIVEMEITGLINVQPLKEELIFRSKLNLETGVATVSSMEDI